MGAAPQSGIAAEATAPDVDAVSTKAGCGLCGTGSPWLKPWIQASVTGAIPVEPPRYYNTARRTPLGEKRDAAESQCHRRLPCRHRGWSRGPGGGVSSMVKGPTGEGECDES
jgi:hypothetical protein